MTRRNSAAAGRESIAKAKQQEPGHMKQATPMGSHFFRPELLMEPLTVYPVCAAKIRDLFYSHLFFRFISHEAEKGSGKKPEPLILLVRPTRFERATLGLEDRRTKTCNSLIYKVGVELIMLIAERIVTNGVSNNSIRTRCNHKYTYCIRHTRRKSVRRSNGRPYTTDDRYADEALPIFRVGPGR